MPEEKENGPVAGVVWGQKVIKFKKPDYNIWILSNEFYSKHNRDWWSLARYQCSNASKMLKPSEYQIKPGRHERGIIKSNWS